MGEVQPPEIRIRPVGDADRPTAARGSVEQTFGSFHQAWRRIRAVGLIEDKDSGERAAWGDLKDRSATTDRAG